MSPSAPIRSFPIEVPEASIVDLRERLARTRWPDSLDGSGWELGTDADLLRDLCSYWATKYDWRRAEARLNRCGSSMIETQGERMHFLHVRSDHPDALPIVITHGWCGSIIEHLDVLDRLVDPPAFGGDAADAFHVVVPSMPGPIYSRELPTGSWRASKRTLSG